MSTYNFVSNFSANGNGVADNCSALATFGATGKLDVGQVVLNIDSGTFKFITNASVSGQTSQRFGFGIADLVIAGAGKLLTVLDGTAFNAGAIQFSTGFGQIHDGSHFAKIATTPRGVTSVTLLDVSKASLFTVGQMVMATGLNIQDLYLTTNGFGYPSNLRFCEFLFVASIVGAVVTFTTPLANDYKSTWPEQNPGGSGEVNSGGPAGIYALDAGTNATVVVRDLTIKTDQQTYANTKTVTYLNVKFDGATSAVPTQNLAWSAINCDAPNADTEFDKLNGVVTVDKSTWNKMVFQSSSSNRFNLTNTSVANGVFGTPNTAYIDNCTIAVFQPGATAYGCTDEVVVSNSTITTLNNGGFVEVGLANTSLSEVNSVYSMAAGLMTVPNGTTISAVADNGSGNTRLTVASSVGFVTGKKMMVSQMGANFTSVEGVRTMTVIDGTHIDVDVVFPGVATYGGAGRLNPGQPARWAVPGRTFLWYAKNGVQGSNRVLDVYQDATMTYVQTDAPGGFPTMPMASGRLNIATLPAQRMTFTNCAGDLDAITHSQPLAAGKPMYAYFNRTYTGNTISNIGANNKIPVCRGILKYIRINVSQAYTGSQGTLTFKLSQFDNWPMIDNTGAEIDLPTITINLKIAGLRTMLPGSSSGAQSGDTISAFGVGSWICDVPHNGVVISADVSGESPAVWPIMTVEMEGDQGVKQWEVAPLRLGLRG